MKKILIAMVLSFVTIWSIGAMAEGIGVVNMQTIFKTSPQAKTINENLKAKFASRKQNIIKLGKTLQLDVQKYQKNQSVMDKKSLTTLQKNINQQSMTLRKAQAKFQSDLVTSQNKKMKAFLDNVKMAVEKVAKKKDLDVVLPNNAVLFSTNKLDVTSDVLAAMKK